MLPCLTSQIITWCSSTSPSLSNLTPTIHTPPRLAATSTPSSVASSALSTLQQPASFSSLPLYNIIQPTLSSFVDLLSGGNHKSIPISSHITLSYPILIQCDSCKDFFLHGKDESLSHDPCCTSSFLDFLTCRLFIPLPFLSQARQLSTWISASHHGWQLKWNLAKKNCAAVRSWRDHDLPGRDVIICDRGMQPWDKHGPPTVLLSSHC